MPTQDKAIKMLEVNSIQRWDEAVRQLDAAVILLADGEVDSVTLTNPKGERQLIGRIAAEHLLSAAKNALARAQASLDMLLDRIEIKDGEE